MVKVIPWESSTWRSIVDDNRKNVVKLKSDLSKARQRLIESEADLEHAEKMGIADCSLPSDYGKILLKRDGIITDDVNAEVGDNASSDSIKEICVQDS